MNLRFPQLLAGSVGALLIYCAIVNKTPVQVLKDTFNAGGGAVDTSNATKSSFGTASGQASSGGASGHNYNLP